MIQFFHLHTPILPLKTCPINCNQSISLHIPVKRMIIIARMLIPIAEMDSTGSNYPGVVRWWCLATLRPLFNRKLDMFLGGGPIRSGKVLAIGFSLDSSSKRTLTVLRKSRLWDIWKFPHSEKVKTHPTRFEFLFEIMEMLNGKTEVRPRKKLLSHFYSCMLRNSLHRPPLRK